MDCLDRSKASCIADGGCRMIEIGVALGVVILFLGASELYFHYFPPQIPTVGEEQ